MFICFDSILFFFILLDFYLILCEDCFLYVLFRKFKKSCFFVVPKSEIRKVLDFCRGDYPNPNPHRSGQTRRRVRRRFLRSLDCKPFCFVRLPCTLQKKKDCSISKACEGKVFILKGLFYNIFILKGLFYNIFILKTLVFKSLWYCKSLCFPSLLCFYDKRKNRRHPNKRGKGVKL